MKYYRKEMDIGLQELVEGASQEMVKKLNEKYKNGYSDWDNINIVQKLWDKLEDHVSRGLSKDNMVDIMNLAAFLWNMADAAERLFLMPETRKEQYNDEAEDGYLHHSD